MEKHRITASLGLLAAVLMQGKSLLVPIPSLKTGIPVD